MRHITSHSFIMASGYGVAEYTHLASEVAHRYPAIDWLSVPHHITSITFGVLFMVAVLHVLPWAARALIALCNLVLFIHQIIVKFWFETCHRIEVSLIQNMMDALWRVLGSLDRQLRNRGRNIDG